MKNRSLAAIYPGTMNLYQATAIDEFTQVTDDNDGSVCLTTAVTMLLNQKRLDRLSNEAIISAITESAQHSDALASLLSKCTDEQLISLVKSRYVQAPSELLAWSSHIESLFPEVETSSTDTNNVAPQQTDTSASAS